MSEETTQIYGTTHGREVLAERLVEIEKRVRALEEAISQQAPVVDEHGNRLDGHDVQFEALTRMTFATQQAVIRLESNVSRLADDQTSSNFAILSRLKRICSKLEVDE